MATDFSKLTKEQLVYRLGHAENVLMLILESYDKYRGEYLCGHLSGIKCGLKLIRGEPLRGEHETEANHEMEEAQ